MYVTKRKELTERARNVKTTLKIKQQKVSLNTQAVLLVSTWPG